VELTHQRARVVLRGLRDQFGAFVRGAEILAWEAFIKRTLN